jgi:antitoxin component YwqK of YwqJK toxin-antitoxin module
MSRTFCFLFTLVLIGCGNSVKRDYLEDGSLWLQYEVNNDGLRDGDYIEFGAKQDTVFHCTYVDDKLNGTFQHFFENNKLHYSVEYNQGRLMHINYYKLEDGSIIQEDNFNEGDGLINVYSSETGKLLTRRNYANGMPFGFRITYFAGGGSDTVFVDSTNIPTYAKDNLPPF